MDFCISDKEFSLFKAWIYNIAGIDFNENKKALVSSRLAKRVSHYKLKSFEDYYNMLTDANSHEVQMAIDLLTTNETYFFREPKHFDYLNHHILPRHNSSQTFRVWSAASSYGQEAYTISMCLADGVPNMNWEILASDISMRVLQESSRGHYPIDQAKNISSDYLKKYALKGVAQQEGTFLIDSNLRKKISFKQINLMKALPDIGVFDVIFLRNVMIYFDPPTKRELIKRIEKVLKPGGYLMVGHSESLNGINNTLKPVVPAVYRKL